MKRGSTLFLQIVVCLIGLVVLAICVFVLPLGLRENTVGVYRPILLGMYIPAIPFFIGAYQTLKLLSFINRRKAFSSHSVRALNYIKYCAFLVSGLYAVGLPYICQTALLDDAPGVMLLGVIFTGAPLIIGVFAALLQKLFQNAIDLKSENELTV